MEEFIAPLGLKVDATEPAKAAVTLDELTAASGKAEAAAKRLNSAQGTAVVSTKALNQATLNLGRQFTDVGTSLASGMSPFMVLVQQGPQITDIFSQLRTQGVGAGAAFKAMSASIAPALPLILGVGAAVGVVVGAFGLFERAVDKQTKNATTFGDTWKAVLKVTGDYIMDGPIGDGLKWMEKAFSKTLDVVTGVVVGGAVKIAGFFGASYLAIVNNWKRLPEVVGVILQNAANAAIRATEWLINKGIDGINALGKNFGFAQIGKVALGQFKAASTDIAAQFDADQKRIEAATIKGINEFVSKVAAQADKNFAARQKSKKAVKEHTDALKLENDTIAATVEIWPEALAIAEAFEKQQRALKTAANDNIKVFDAAGASIPSRLENMATEAERVAYQTREITWGVEDIANAINRNDWTSAFASLTRVLVQVQNGFKAGATSAEKFAAAAALAQGVGSVIGGTAGSTLSGAASGALAGSAFGAPGAIIGGAIGFIGGIFGSSKAKKQAKAQAAAQAAAEAAARQQQISDTTFSINVALLEAQGKAEEALAMTRQRELDALAKLDPALVTLQQQLYAAQDAAEAAAKAAEAQAAADAIAAQNAKTQRAIMLDLMALDDAVLGTNSAVLAARQDELATLDPVSRALKEIYYARIDEGAALEKQAAAQKAAAEAAADAARVEAEAFARSNELWANSTQKAIEEVTAAAQRQAEAMRALGDSFAGAIEGMQGLSKSLTAFAASIGLDIANSQGKGYAMSRNALLSASSEGRLGDIQALGEAFLQASQARNGDGLAFIRDQALVRSLALQGAASANSRAGGIADVFRNIQGFATGGSFEVGGSGPPDSKFIGMALSPGEMVNVTRPGTANDNSEIAALRQEVRELKQVIAAGLSKVADNTKDTHDLLRNGTITTVGG